MEASAEFKIEMLGTTWADHHLGVTVGLPSRVTLRRVATNPHVPNFSLKAFCWRRVAEEHIEVIHEEMCVCLWRGKGGREPPRSYSVLSHASREKHSRFCPKSVPKVADFETDRPEFCPTVELGTGDLSARV